MLIAVGHDGEIMPDGKITDPVFLLVEAIAGQFRQVTPQVEIIGIVPILRDVQIQPVQVFVHEYPVCPIECQILRQEQAGRLAGSPDRGGRK